MLGNIGSKFSFLFMSRPLNVRFLLAMRMKYTLSMLDGYVVSQFERLQSGYEGMADYVAAINVVARSAVKQAYSSGFTIDKQDPVSIKLHFNLLANLPYSFPNV